VDSEEILVLPVVHDALCARIALQAGAKALACGGYSSSAALLGKPDVSLLTLTEMVDWAGRIVDATDLPVFADADTGHGNVTNVVRTVRLFEKAGVAGIFMEDQETPKRCGHMTGKTVIPAHAMVAKLRAALDARRDPDFVIMARTDALAVHGIEDALDRANLYHEEGADMIFVEAPEDVDQMRRIASEIKAPTMANMIPGGKTPILSAKELQGMGYAVVTYPTACTYVIAKAVRELFTRLHEKGTTVGLDHQMLSFHDFNNLVGLEEIRAAEDKYLRRSTPLS
jgi:methylisocitrate lyase